MSYEYRQNNQASPYAYGHTATSCPHPNLPESQGQGMNGLPNSNIENSTSLPKIGEQNPHEPDSSSASKNQNNTLNFGWFSIPRANQGCAPGDDRLNSPGVAGGVSDNITSTESNQRPLSKEGLRPDSQQRTISQQGKQHPSSDGGVWPDSQGQCMGEPADRCEDGQAGFHHKEQDYNQKYQNQSMQPIPEDSVIVDWPMSVIARAHMPKPQNTPQLPNQPKTPVARSEVPAVPPTPLPPLHWQGYQNCSRPTYATWRDSWHHNIHPTATGNYVNDSNNSNCRDGKQNKKHGNKANKTRGKNTNNSNNNTNDVVESPTSKECSSNNTLSDASDYSADGNNNNWMIVDDHAPSPRTQIRTLPPYGQSSEAVPKFYSPSVVMKWEDTDDLSNSSQEKQNFKQVSLMKRIRTSFFQIWSTLFCLKNQKDEEATQESRLFKYDRFDNCDNPKSYAQGTGDRA